MPYLMVLTEMQYFHIRFHMALPSPFMARPGAQGGGFQAGRAAQAEPAQGSGSSPALIHHFQAIPPTSTPVNSQGRQLAHLQARVTPFFMIYKIRCLRGFFLGRLFGAALKAPGCRVRKLYLASTCTKLFPFIPIYSTPKPPPQPSKAAPENPF